MLQIDVWNQLTGLKLEAILLSYGRLIPLSSELGFMGILGRY